MQEIFVLVNPSSWAVPEIKPLRSSQKMFLCLLNMVWTLPSTKCVFVCMCVCGSFLNGEVTQYDASYTQALI